MPTYEIITTVELTQDYYDENGDLQTLTIPPGSVINRIIWNGTSPWEQPENTEIRLAE